MRRGKTDRVPKTRAGGEWTEAAFWGFLRSGLRQISRRWPPLVRIAAQMSRREYHGPNKRQKWEYLCAGCGQWYMRKEIEIDHRDGCGPLKSFVDLSVFAERLFCEADKLCVLCSRCHEMKTQAAKTQPKPTRELFPAEAKT